MMPEEWPIAAFAADENAPARFAGRGRLATVRRDFFLNPAKRLTEQERALMTAMRRAKGLARLAGQERRRGPIDIERTAYEEEAGAIRQLVQRVRPCLELRHGQ